MKKLIPSALLLITSAWLLSACSLKSFTLSNIKRHLMGPQPTTVVSPAPTAESTPAVTAEPTAPIQKAK
jgi:hypothetical protein